MSEWKMLTLVGEDRPGIVARLTDALFAGGWNLGEASMIRLGGNFSIMLMISGSGDAAELIRPVAGELGLHAHVDDISGGLHQHLLPNVQVRVNGADRAGIVAQVTGVLVEKGFNILELESDVAGSAEKPLYIMNIEGYSESTLEDLEQALDALHGIDVSVADIETLIG